MNEFATPKLGSGGVNLRSKPVVDATTKVGALAEGARIQLEQAGVDWHSCLVYVSKQGAQTANGFVSLRPDWFQINLRLAPTITDATDVGDLVSGQQLELFTPEDEWFVARVFLSAQFADVVSPSDPTPPPPAPPPSTGLLTPDELRNVRLSPSQTRVPPAGFSQNHMKAAQIWNDYGGMVEFLAGKVGIGMGQAVAVVAIESGGNGFGRDGRMVIRFEVHLFWNQWGKNNPDLFNAHFAFDPNTTWQGHKFRLGPNAPWQNFHNDLQAGEWNAFTLAQQLNDRAAKLSISMGLAQIVGFNHKRIGYNTVEEMFDALKQDERFQLLSLFSFIVRDANMVRALQQGDLVAFARGYNGSGQAEHYARLIAGVQQAFGELVAQRALRRSAGRSAGGSLWSASLRAPVVAPSNKAKPKTKHKPKRKKT
jgi:hypothetical protein